MRFDTKGKKDILGLWIGESKVAKFWLKRYFRRLYRWPKILSDAMAIVEVKNPTLRNSYDSQINEIISSKYTKEFMSDSKEFYGSAYDLRNKSKLH